MDRKARKIVEGVWGGVTGDDLYDDFDNPTPAPDKLKLAVPRGDVVALAVHVAGNYNMWLLEGDTATWMIAPRGARAYVETTYDLLTKQDVSRGKASHVLRAL